MTLVASCFVCGQIACICPKISTLEWPPMGTRYGTNVIRSNVSNWQLCPKCNAEKSQCLVCEGTGLISEITGNPPRRKKNVEE